MKITALAPWYGSKRTLAPRIVDELGPHTYYVEPFGGSLAVLLRKPASSMETVNDMHGDLINLARVLASESGAVELYGRASRMLMHEDLHTESKHHIKATECVPPETVGQVETSHIDRALHYLVMSWQGRNGSAGTMLSNITLAKRFTHNGGSGGLRWLGAVESIPAWHERLRAVQIMRMDAIALLTRLGDQDKTVIYADPPYVEKGAKYVHDFDQAGHEQLAGVLRSFRRARVVVSYYDHPLVRELYDGWTLVECPVAKALVNGGRRDQTSGPEKAPEILLINGRSHTSEEKLF